MLKVNLLVWEEPDQIDPIIPIWFTYEDGDEAVEVHYEGQEEPRIVTHIKAHGIVGRMSKEFTLKDGKEFMEELRFEFFSSRLRATEPFEVK